jgi:hypothetical protein
MKKRLDKINPAGLVVSGQGTGGGPIEGPLEVLFAGAVGALAGFVLGMLFGSFARIFTINRVKGMIGGRHWAAYGAGAGALGLAVVEYFC